ncbi:cation-transporting P-type ATPase [Candidatus Babeliales bacterium]|nr:cation-transporting P-type ATPase [Candidatus Babeliales bacterium]MBP9843424.1 cation-transporting P-type ATPase [Candidatus Babeliales bacterium]
MKPYQQTPEEICKELQTSCDLGLTNTQYQKNLKNHGYNHLVTKKHSSIFFIFFSQFFDPLTYMLFGAAGIILTFGEFLDACIITGILIFNALIGTIQEKRTEKILNSLQNFFECDSRVIRDGQQHIIANHLIVPGDLIYLEPGEKIPADARIITATNLTTDESALTGESTPVSKSAQTIENDDIALNEQHNILLAGTYILTGQATAIIFATGKHTQAGKIYEAVETIDTQTPLKKELETLSRWILIFISCLCSTLFVIGLINKKPVIDLIITLTALFICVVPEGLPVVLTIIFVTGAYKMAQQNVLVKKLKAIDALGKIDVIITDKTGTLTRNEMMVSNVFVDNKSLHVTGSGYFLKGSIQDQAAHDTVLQEIAIACALLNDTQIEFDEKLKIFKIKGSPTQAAAFIFAQKVNAEVKKAIEGFTINSTIPFDTSYKYAAVFCEKDSVAQAFVLGATDVLVPRCKNAPDIKHQLEQYFERGYRVVAVTKKIVSHKTNNKKNSNNLEQAQDFDARAKDLADHHELIQSDLEFLGLLAISDEPRDNLKAVMEQVAQANVQIIMATGDHPRTAFYIAEQVGITSNEKHSITSQEFEKLSDEQALELFGDHNFICARFLPQDKLRLVNLFHSKGKIVATTGDGINDVPALVASDVSIAMGTIGTQLTKQTADMILLNDSFDNIIYAMQQGRVMFDALRRAILYFLTSNASEVFIVFFALLINTPLPLLPSQILLLNLITDGFLDAALVMEPVHEDQLKSYTRANMKLFDKAMAYKTLSLALPAGFISFFTFLSLYSTDLALARTLTFITLMMIQWFNALNCRSEKKSIFNIGLFSNFWLSVVSAIIMVLQLLIVYAPPMHYVFKTVPLQLHHWIYAVAVASTVLIFEETRKFVINRF